MDNGPAFDPRYTRYHLGNDIPSTLDTLTNIWEGKAYVTEPKSFILTNPSLKPLSFHHANESHLPSSLFPVFKLSEVHIDQVLSYLSTSDFASLALVDKDCRQLARTRQFRSVWLNYSNASTCLLGELTSEATARLENRNGKQKWTLGACIRRITISADFESRTPTYNRRRPVNRKAAHARAVECHKIHMKTLQFVLPCAVPNLSFLHWMDHIPLSSSLANTFTNSPITRLALHTVYLDEDFEISGCEQWQLRTLTLRLNVLPFQEKMVSTVRFTRSILKLAASTLEVLVWDGSQDSQDDTINFETNERVVRGVKHSFGSEPISFPRLEKLEITRVLMADGSILSSLFPAKDEEIKLTNIFLDSQDRQLAPFFARRGHIPTLKHLTWTDFPMYQDIDQCVSFISANPQLKTFQYQETSPNLPDEHLIPLFASKFRNLTSLALVWREKQIKPESLELIGRIITLQHLWLSAGAQWAPQLDWPVDHSCLRRTLEPLKRLEWFVLTRECYPHWYGHPEGLPSRQSQEWEDKHREIMVREGTAFAQSHPKLKFVYFGQIAMGIERRGRGGVVPGEDVISKPLTREREAFSKSHTWIENEFARRTSELAVGLTLS